MVKRMTRRALLRTIGIAASGAMIAACQPKVVEKIVKETVEVEKVVEKEKVVKETVVVAGTPKVVEKVVKETVVVEAEEKVEPSEVQEFRMVAGCASATAMTTMQDNFGFPVSLLFAPMYSTDCKFNPTTVGLAESWEELPGGMGYIFHLRRDAKFSDGTPITAKDMAWSLGYSAMMAFPSFYGVRNNWGYFRQRGFMIKGAQEVLDGKITFDEFDAAPLEGVKVVDDFTLQLEFTNPYPFFMESFFCTVVKPDSVMAGKDKGYGTDTYWTTEPDCAFSGSWKLASFKSGQGISMVPNPEFYGPKPKLSKIIVQCAADLNTGIAAFQNKEVDAVFSMLQPMHMRQCKADPYLSQCLTRITSYHIHQLWVTPYPPMDDVHVRRAIYMAIDKDKLCEVMNAGDDYYRPIISHFVPENPGCLDAKKNVKAMPFDPAKAKEELLASKYGESVLDMELNIIQPNNDYVVEVGAIQKMLQDNLGLKNVKIRTERIVDNTKPPFATHLWPNNQGDNRPDSWFTLVNMPKTMMDHPAAPGEVIPRVTAPYEPDFMDMCNKIRDETDLAKRCQYTAELYQAWVDRAYSIDLWTYDGGYLIAPWVKDLNICLDTTAYAWLSPGMETCWIAKR